MVAIEERESSILSVVYVLSSIYNQKIIWWYLISIPLLDCNLGSCKRISWALTTIK